MKKGVRIGMSELQAAQDATGLSNESIARELHISEKTWRRWKKEGEVPRYHLRPVAKVLHLQIEVDGDRVVQATAVEPDTDDQRLARLEKRVEGMDGKVGRILDLLEPGAEPQSG